MMDWTDRHCRFFLRLISRRARLYTEMVTAPALAHGDVPRHLDFDPAEHPVALQLGGSDPRLLAHAAKLGEHWGYDEINLNCGCPSERVQTGSFGAWLMAEPALVADCLKAMRDAVSLPVTVKHRIGIDANEDYAFVRDFVGTVVAAGCDVFVVHARNAVQEEFQAICSRCHALPDIKVHATADWPAVFQRMERNMERMNVSQASQEQTSKILLYMQGAEKK